MSVLPWLAPGRIEFPPPEQALDDPPGLLAAGGDLSPERLLEAYRQGIFPWYEPGSPILWWCPDPRAVIRPEAVHVSRSLRKRLNKRDYHVTADTAFHAVIAACAAPRDGHAGTWITPGMRAAYIRLHELGYAHSVEVWLPQEREPTLAGALYGVSIGRAFFGESMFTRRTDASKIAFVHLLGQLAVWGFPLVDCQLQNPHLARLGVREMPRPAFLDRLAQLVAEPTRFGPWRLEWDWRRDGPPARLS